MHMLRVGVSLFSLLLMHAANVQAQWVQTTDHMAGIFTLLAVSGSGLFAGTDRGAYHSTNNGGR